jgi:hypothetical protein
MRDRGEGRENERGIMKAEGLASRDTRWLVDGSSMALGVADEGLGNGIEDSDDDIRD